MFRRMKTFHEWKSLFWGGGSTEERAGGAPTDHTIGRGPGERQRNMNGEVFMNSYSGWTLCVSWLLWVNENSYFLCVSFSCFTLGMNFVCQVAVVSVWKFEFSLCFFLMLRLFMSCHSCPFWQRSAHAWVFVKIMCFFSCSWNVMGAVEMWDVVQCCRFFGSVQSVARCCRFWWDVRCRSSRLSWFWFARASFIASCQCWQDCVLVVVICNLLILECVSR